MVTAGSAVNAAKSNVWAVLKAESQLLFGHQLIERWVKWAAIACTDKTADGEQGWAATGWFTATLCEHGTRKTGHCARERAA